MNAPVAAAFHLFAFVRMQSLLRTHTFDVCIHSFPKPIAEANCRNLRLAAPRHGEGQPASEDERGRPRYRHGEGEEVGLAIHYVAAGSHMVSMGDRLVCRFVRLNRNGLGMRGRGTRDEGKRRGARGQGAKSTWLWGIPKHKYCSVRNYE